MIKFLKVFSLGGLLAGLVFLILLFSVLLEHRKFHTLNREMIFLPSPKVMKMFSMSHEELTADLLSIQAALHYGKTRRRGERNLAYLNEILERVITLDPHFYSAYLFAGQLLKDPIERIEFLKKALARFPNDWRIPEMIGFQYFYELKDKISAAKFYELAASKEGHPPYIPSMASRFYRDSGQYEQAIAILREYAGTSGREAVKKEFLARAKYLEEIHKVQVAIRSFSREQNRLPQGFNDLLNSGHLSKRPQLKSGWQLTMDQQGELRLKIENKKWQRG